MTTHHFLSADAIDDVMVLELQDNISNMPDHTILNELEEIRRQRREIGATKLIFDLGKAQYFGSTLLELIRVVWNDLTALKGKLVLCNPSPFGREILEIAKFHLIWPLLETRAEALAMLGSGPNVASWPTELQESLTKYERGPEELRQALKGFSAIELRTPAPPGVWSVHQIVCHIADFELVYADRMKRVVAEDQPTMFGGDPDVFAEKLAYAQRHLEEELDVITAVRRQTSRFLKTLVAHDFERTGIHSVDGPLTLQVLLGRIAGHIPHHLKLIEGKRQTFTSRQSN
ncbi:DinB family protein [Schlesneria paludicola]|uniref:DinB family protein n=1 Tax=Schlesneria paludicola TaxID=360056 RepID=UPI0012FC191A|nr:DinB family protein [Schlesneria paludicola]